MRSPSTIDDAADTLRFIPITSDQTSLYALAIRNAAAVLVDTRRRRVIRATRRAIARLRECLAEGWDVGPELAHEERRLGALVGV